MVLEQWNEAVQSDVEVLKQVRIFIEQLKTPFGFLVDQVKKAQKNIVINAAKERQQEEEGDHRYHEQEQKMKKEFDGRAAELARKYNVDYETIPWLEVSQGVTLVYLILTLLVMFQRKDMISITVCVCAIYVLQNPQYIDR